MNTPDDFDWLDNVLSGDGGYIDDNGFTDNVMRRLPPRKPQRRFHALILSVASLLSVAVLLWSLPAFYAQLADFVYSQSLFTLGLLTATLCAAAGLLTAWLLNLDK